MTALGIVVTAGGIFLLAIDGAVCLLMALPIARSGEAHVDPAAVALVVLPIALLLDTHTSPPPLHEVRSSIEIDAPPASVRRTRRCR